MTLIQKPLNIQARTVSKFILKIEKICKLLSTLAGSVVSSGRCALSSWFPFFSSLNYWKLLYISQCIVLIDFVIYASIQIIIVGFTSANYHLSKLIVAFWSSLRKSF